MDRVANPIRSQTTTVGAKTRNIQKEGSSPPVLKRYSIIKTNNYSHLSPPTLRKEESLNTANHEPIFSQFPTQASASTDVTKSKTLLTTGIPDCQYSPRKKLDRIPPKRIARVIGNGLYVKEGKNRLAGEALFSRVTIQKGCLITEYAGVKRLLSQKDKAYYKNHFQEATHFASIDSMTVVDGYKEVSKGMHAGSTWSIVITSKVSMPVRSVQKRLPALRTSHCTAGAIKSSNNLIAPNAARHLFRNRG
ncbi:hypothetical protein ElyMa_005607400 [Elysia marginata]|uniref:SET domain-containing protein n=1 Tax=Elysia marginata TaxID=1093978 RepID=A0AAV4F6K1_9GAST|nr:hypothetical protein ElyMa_005607400 [Elysia marginata]